MLGFGDWRRCERVVRVTVLVDDDTNLRIRWFVAVESSEETVDREVRKRSPCFVSAHCGGLTSAVSSGRSRRFVIISLSEDCGYSVQISVVKHVPWLQHIK